VGCLSGPARADYLYSFSSPFSQFKFLEPNLLTTTTTKNNPDLFDVLVLVENELLGSVNINNPLSGLLYLQMNYPGGGYLAAVGYNFPGVFDHVGTYESQGGGATLTITDASAPEISPGNALSALALLSGMLAIVRAKRR
jgi:hypothetical protein